jgi:hypothetical protein
MPVSDPILDPDYADLLGELRDARTPTPPALVVRVDDLLARFEPPAPRAPARRRLRRPGRLRRPSGAPLAGVAVLCCLLGVGVLIAKTGPGSDTTQSAASSAAATTAGPGPAAGGGDATTAAAATVASEASPAFEAQPDTNRQAAGAAAPATDGGADLGGLTPVTPDPGRLQHQESHLEIALASPDDVADATGQVTRAITGYGGHIVTVQFATPEGRHARSQIVAKVPIERMEEATARFTDLGRLAAAQVDISDLQAQADTLEQKVAAVRLQVAQFTARLASPDLTKLQRATLVERRARARARLADLNASVARARQSAAQADLTVVLTTDDDAVAPVPSSPGAGDRAREALDVLADIGVYAVWLLVVLAPFAVLAAAVLGTRQLVRRRRERRLLETA